MNTRPKWFVIILYAQFTILGIHLALCGPAVYLLMVGFRLPQLPAHWMAVGVLVLVVPGTWLTIKCGSRTLQFSGAISGPFDMPRLDWQQRWLAVIIGPLMTMAGLGLLHLAWSGQLQRFLMLLLATVGPFQMILGVCLLLWGLDELAQERRLHRQRDEAD